jgi:hypothetical protein
MVVMEIDVPIRDQAMADEQIVGFLPLQATREVCREGKRQLQSGR